MGSCILPLRTHSEFPYLIGSLTLDVVVGISIPVPYGIKFTSSFIFRLSLTRLRFQHNKYANPCLLLSVPFRSFLITHAIEYTNMRMKIAPPANPGMKYCTHGVFSIRSVMKWISYTNMAMR